MVEYVKNDDFELVWILANSSKDRMGMITLSLELMNQTKHIVIS